ncbi:hypothetical protein [Pleionea sediminis]|uniref:hypothetical protein n=1 Tax=Pleionea sediminis TaxID=2569479 RepID=UPI001184BBD5|nr:hypothetical protein [Pleionea sediminis]
MTPITTQRLKAIIAARLYLGDAVEQSEIERLLNEEELGHFNMVLANNELTQSLRTMSMKSILDLVSTSSNNTNLSNEKVTSNIYELSDVKSSDSQLASNTLELISQIRAR